MGFDFLDNMNFPQPETSERIISRMMEKENIEMKTDLKDAVAFAQLKLLGDLSHGMGVPSLKVLIDSFMESVSYYKVSESRGGRKEIFESVKPAMSNFNEYADRIMERMNTGVKR